MKPAAKRASVLCTTRIAEAALWEPHLRSAEHAEAVARARIELQRKRDGASEAARSGDGDVAHEHAMAAESEATTAVLPAIEPMAVVAVDQSSVVDLEGELARFQRAINAQGAQRGAALDEC